MEDAAWLSGGKWVIRGGTVAMWAPISRVDLRVELQVPGGITTYAMDVNGKR